MAVKTIDEHTKQATAFYDPYKQKELDSANQVYTEQEKVLNDSYNSQIADVKKSYVDVERENAIQKLINEREIEENMSNMGLSNSGLNRTQQTAVQLSYANNQNKINLQRQAEVDSLAQSLAQEISTIKQNRIASEADINSKYSSLISDMATTNYNNELKEETERQKAYYSAQVKLAEQATKKGLINADGALIDPSYSGSLQSNNVTVTYYTDNDGNKKTKYVDSITGKTTILDRDQSPYKNGEVNPDTKYGTFSNGYQPNNIDGDKLEVYATGEANGITYNIYKRVISRTGKLSNGCFIWNRALNRYVQAVKQADGTWKGIW